MKSENRQIRPEKAAMAQELKEKVSGALYVILADYDGMTMPQTDKLRAELRGADAEYHVVKNRLFRHVMADAGQDTGADMLKGQTAVVLGSGDVVEVAKVLKKFAKENEKPAMKGGLLEGALLSADDVIALAALPPKEQLQAMLVGTLAAPMSGLVGVMNQKLASIVYVLKAAQDKKAQEA